MSRRKLAVALGCLLLATSVTAFAAKGGGGMNSGGMSSGHMSSAGQRSTNGPESLDRDKGLQRAEDRRSASGASHEKAQLSKAKGKSHRP